MLEVGVSHKLGNQPAPTGIVGAVALEFVEGALHCAGAPRRTSDAAILAGGDAVPAPLTPTGPQTSAGFQSSTL